MCPLPPPPKTWGDFNFEKLKSLGEEFFFHHLGASPYEGDSDNDSQRKGAGIIQIRTITRFFL